jgi:Bacterial extracellular solute-binding proteins, family 5 Middle/Double zinc ribbon
MVMHEEDSAVPDGPVSPCGHRNVPSAHFCDVCGVKLPLQCPRCHAFNRRQANFCSNCGIGLGDVQRTHAAPSIVPFGPSPDSAPATESESAPASPEPIVPAKQATNERMDGPKFFDLLPLTAESGKELVADEPENAERLEQMVRSFQRRRRRRRAWVRGTVGVSVVIGVLGAAALVGTRIAPPSAKRPPFIDTAAQASIATRAEVSESAAIAQSTPGSTGPPDTTVQPDQPKGSPAPTAPEKSPAVAPAHPRAGGELKFVVPGEAPSYDAHREETFALIHPAAPHYNTLLRIDPLDPTGTLVVGDLATSWTVSPDRRTYVLRLRRGVKFHDGSEMTSRDVRAT